MIRNTDEIAARLAKLTKKLALPAAEQRILIDAVANTAAGRERSRPALR